MKTIKIIATIGLVIATLAGCATTTPQLTKEEVYSFKLEDVHVVGSTGNYESFMKNGVIFLRGSALAGGKRKVESEGTYQILSGASSGYAIYAAYDAMTNMVFIMRSDVHVSTKHRLTDPPPLAGLMGKPAPTRHRKSITSESGIILSSQNPIDGCLTFTGAPCLSGRDGFLDDKECACCAPKKYVDVAFLEAVEYTDNCTLEERHREGGYGNWWGYDVYIVHADDKLKSVFRKLTGRETVTSSEMSMLYGIKERSIVETIKETIKNKLEVKGGFLFGIPTADIRKGPYEKLWEIIQHFRGAKK